MPINTDDDRIPFDRCRYKPPMGRGTFGLITNLLFSPPHFIRFTCQMSSLSRQSTISPPPSWMGEPNSDPLWSDGVMNSALDEEARHLLEEFTTLLESSTPLSAGYPLPSLDGDNTSPPPAFFGGAEGIDGMSSAYPPPAMALSAQPGEQYVTFSSSHHYRSQLLITFIILTPHAH